MDGEIFMTPSTHLSPPSVPHSGKEYVQLKAMADLYKWAGDEDKEGG